MQRLAITGSSGYLGQRLVQHFRRGGVRVLGIDVRPPKRCKPDEFVETDICDPQLGDALKTFAPDTVIHAAFVFQPMRDKRRMRQINVGGTNNMLAAVEQVRPDRLMLISSATAYGAWPDNPVPMEEDWPLRARGFQYAADKTEVERRIKQFARQHDEMAVSWVRPAIIGGPKMDNYLRRFIFGMPILIRIDGYDTPLQFVHERDVVAAIEAILAADGRGAYNVGPSDWTPLSQIAVETGRRALKLPFWLVRLLHGLAWTIRLPIHESPASFLYFARYPWVVASKRLQDELGFEFQFSSSDTLREIIRNTPKRTK